MQRIRAEKYGDVYGSPRMHRALRRRGVACSRNTVAKYMREEGIRAKRKTKFRIATTDSDHDRTIAPNRVNQQFETKSINQVWLTDLTYIRTREGFSYLCAVEDLHSRRIVGWDIRRSLSAELAVSALEQAIALRDPSPGLIVHSDRGSQFASDPFRKRLTQRRLIQSMSRKGNCYDNAPMESFFKSFKTESVGETIFESHEHAARAAVDYIERFYNRHRLHSALDYQSPVEFEATLRPDAEEKLPSSEPFVARSQSSRATNR